MTRDREPRVGNPRLRCPGRPEPARRPATPAGVLAAAVMLAAGCASPPVAPPAAAPDPAVAAPAPPVPAAAAAPSTPPPVPSPMPPVELLASHELATGHRFAGTEVGGLSALALDPETGDWLALSDDGGEAAEERGPVRLYRLRPVPGEGLDPLAGGVEWLEVIPLTRGGAPPSPDEIDTEGLAIAGDALWVASEGVAAGGVPPFVRRFDRTGTERAELPLPEAFVPAAGGSAGVRNNLGFEALALTPDGRRLIAGTESALVQDGPAADFGVPALARLVVWDLAAGEVVAQHLYPLDPVPFEPHPLLAGRELFRVNGLVELVALDRDRLLALERAFAIGRGTALRLYLVDLSAAHDVSGVRSLAAHEAAGEPTPRPAAKTLVADLGELLAAAGVAPDNVEAMAFGPDLPDGRRVLWMVSDNNFSPLQRTLFLAFAVTPSALR